MLVLSIVGQINELRVKRVNEATVAESTDESSQDTQPRPKTLEKHATSLIFVILEICIKDLIKYLPNLLGNGNSLNFPPNKSSFLYLHVTQCKQLNVEDVELLSCVLRVLSELPFHTHVRLEKRISLISIIYHINFSLAQAIEALMDANENNSEAKQKLEASLYESICDSVKIMCCTSAPISQWHSCFQIAEKAEQDSVCPGLIQALQSALLNTLTLKSKIYNFP